MRQHRNYFIFAIIAILVTGCATPTGSRQPTQQEIEEKMFASAKRSLVIKPLPVGADMENWRDQAGMAASGYYLTWTGEVKPLPEDQKQEPEEALPTPKASYEKYVPGAYEGMGTVKPVDIMR